MARSAHSSPAPLRGLHGAARFSAMGASIREHADLLEFFVRGVHRVVGGCWSSPCNRERLTAPSPAGVCWGADDACSQEVGIWLETDWYRQQAVIKEVKKDSYAFKHTDVQVKGYAPGK